jgi:hypothetical protein
VGGPLGFVFPSLAAPSGAADRREAIKLTITESIRPVFHQRTPTLEWNKNRTVRVNPPGAEIWISDPLPTGRLAKKNLKISLS